MFDTPDTERKSGAGMWIVIAVIVVLVAGGAYWYMSSKGSATSATPAMTASAAPTTAAGADPVKDLRVVSTKMDKDPTGNVAVWSVEIKNQSPTFTYSNINYQTTYIAGDNSVLLQNKGTMSLSLEPGGDQTAEFRDALFPTGTALYRVAILGASSTQ
jgi:hypothetical protein